MLTVLDYFLFGFLADGFCGEVARFFGAFGFAVRVALVADFGFAVDFFVNFRGVFLTGAFFAAGFFTAAFFAEVFFAADFFTACFLRTAETRLTNDAFSSSRPRLVAVLRSRSIS